MGIEGDPNLKPRAARAVILYEAPTICPEALRFSSDKWQHGAVFEPFWAVPCFAVCFTLYVSNSENYSESLSNLKYP